MLNLKQIKTPDLAEAIGMSLRNLRRYEYGDLKFKSIKGMDYMKKCDKLFYDAKVGLLIETLSDEKINEKLLIIFNCAKEGKKNNSMDELKRLAKVGELIGTWYFNDNFKQEMVK